MMEENGSLACLEEYFVVSYWSKLSLVNLYPVFNKALILGK